jgi:hypothetical protein
MLKKIMQRMAVLAAVLLVASHVAAVNFIT